MSKDQGIPRNVKFQGDTPAALGRKACTTEAEEGMEREGHVQDSGRKQLIWEGPWKLKDDSKGPSWGHEEMRDRGGKSKQADL